MNLTEQITIIPEFNANLIKQFNEPGPYYSSYPPLSRWSEELQGKDYLSAMKHFFSEFPNAPIYLYLHIPYCAKLCWYCICNIEISNNRERIQRFVDILLLEIEQLKRFFDNNKINPNIREIHFGGGTPSHLDHFQLKQLVDQIRIMTDIENLDEFAMEIDPRTVKDGDLFFYRSLGIDRISFGVQDFDPDVQRKINRIQPFELVEKLLSNDIRDFYKGVNFDLLYGLPSQTRESFRKTLELTKILSPDRITLIKYAHVPELRKHMKMIEINDLPSESVIPLMFQDAVKSLLEAGYIWVGIDNFAKKQDELGKSSINKTTGRNFSGSSPGRADNIIGLGPTSTSAFGNYYFQSVYDIQDYSKSIISNEFPIFKGYILNEDDRIRRDIIFSIQCRHEINIENVEHKYKLTFADRFKSEILRLENLELKGMIHIDNKIISVMPLGRFYIPHICRIFDPILVKNPDYTIHGP